MKSNCPTCEGNKWLLHYCHGTGQYRQDQPSARYASLPIGWCGRHGDHAPHGYAVSCGCRGASYAPKNK